MRTAIALFGDEVSPRFGCSRRFLVVTHEDGREVERFVLPAENVAPGRLPALLGAHGVGEVICGGIHHRFLDELRARGTAVIWGVIGPAGEALAARLANRLEPNQFMAAGRCRQRRRPGRGRGPAGPGDPGEADERKAP